jgi:hypothetical protein
MVKPNMSRRVSAKDVDVRYCNPSVLIYGVDDQVDDDTYLYSDASAITTCSIWYGANSVQVQGGGRCLGSVDVGAAWTSKPMR